MAGWLHGAFVGDGFSFFHCVASPFHSFVTTTHSVPSVDIDASHSVIERIVGLGDGSGYGFRSRCVGWIFGFCVILSKD